MMAFATESKDELIDTIGLLRAYVLMFNHFNRFAFLIVEQDTKSAVNSNLLIITLIMVIIP